jgi:hypothetical protein
MAIQTTNFQFNERGMAFKFIGDGATTVLPAVTFPRHVRPGTAATVFVETNHTSHAVRSGRTGLTTGVGTIVSATVAISGTSFTVTTGAAVGNGVPAQVEIVFAGENQ